MERTHFTWLSYRFCPGIPQLLVCPLCPARGCHRELQVLQGLQCCQAHGETASLGFKFHIPWFGLVQGLCSVVCAQCGDPCGVVPWHWAASRATVAMAAWPVLRCVMHVPAWPLPAPESPAGWKCPALSTAAKPCRLLGSTRVCSICRGLGGL